MRGEGGRGEGMRRGGEERGEGEGVGSRGIEKVKTNKGRTGNEEDLTVKVSLLSLYHVLQTPPPLHLHPHRVPVTCVRGACVWRRCYV